MEELVYAELQHNLSFDMMLDPLLVVISDSALFIITTPENSKKYEEEEFFSVTPLAREEYQIVFENGRLVSKVES